VTPPRLRRRDRSPRARDTLRRRPIPFPCSASLRQRPGETTAYAPRPLRAACRVTRGYSASGACPPQRLSCMSQDAGTVAPARGPATHACRKDTIAAPPAIASELRPLGEIDRAHRVEARAPQRVDRRVSPARTTGGTRCTADCEPTSEDASSVRRSRQRPCPRVSSPSQSAHLRWISSPPPGGSGSRRRQRQAGAGTGLGAR
jgi:hypothetical protein